MGNKIVLFGATGYTGRLTAEAMRKRGLDPVIAGRSREKLEELAERLGIKQIAVADISKPDSVAALVNKGDVLVTTVGPFTLYGEAALEAATLKGAHYIDSTGEPGFIRKVFDDFGPRAKEEGSALITAGGYDYIPGNLAAASALQAAGSAATRVDVGYFNVGRFDMSDGTRASLRTAILDQGRIFESGKLEIQAAGKKMRAFDVDGKEKSGLSISSTEHYSLPHVFPNLKDINVYLGWFGSKTNLVMKASKVQNSLMENQTVKKVITKSVEMASRSRGIGPDLKQRESSTSLIVAEVFDDSGKLLKRADCVGVNGYTFTGGMIAWMAEQVSSGKFKGTGALGPVEAFGLESLTAGCREAGMEVILSK